MGLTTPLLGAMGRGGTRSGADGGPGGDLKIFDLKIFTMKLKIKLKMGHFH